MSRTSRTFPPAQRRWTFWLPVVALWVIPIGVLIAVLPAAGAVEKDAVERDLPESVIAGSRERDYAQRVTATFAVTDEPTAHLSGSGLLRRIHWEPEELLTEGDAVVTVDDVTVRVHRGKRPFYRELTAGARGDDVVELARYFANIGIEGAHPDDGNRFGRSLTTAVRTYQRDYGIPDDGVFRPEYVLYLPKSITALGEPTINVGTRVDADQTFALPSRVVTEVTILTTDGQPPTTGGHPGPFDLAAGDASIELASITPDLEGALDLHDGLIAAGAPLTDGTDEGTITATSLTLTVATPVEVGVVPTSAVHGTTDGTFCLFRVPGSSADATPEAVSLKTASALEGEVALTAIDPDLAGTTVIRAVDALDQALLDKCF